VKRTKDENAAHDLFLSILSASFVPLVQIGNKPATRRKNETPIHSFYSKSERRFFKT